MPIRPEMKSLYPADWHEISRRVKIRAGNRCEMILPDGSRCEARQYERHPVTGARVILTTMHLDHNPENCDPSNLMAACQKCHNGYDMAERVAGRKRRIRRKIEITQTVLQLTKE